MRVTFHVVNTSQLLSPTDSWLKINFAPFGTTYQYWTSRTEQGHTRVHFDLSKIPSLLCDPTCKMFLARIQNRWHSNLIQKASNNLQDSFQTPSRHHTDTLCTFKSPSKNPLLHFHINKRRCSQISRVGCGLQVHNHATSWPNLQDGSCKNSI